MLIYVCYLSVVLCHRRWLVAIFLIGQDWPIHYLYIYVSERDDLCHFLLIT